VAALSYSEAPNASTHIDHTRYQELQVIFVGSAVASTQKNTKAKLKIGVTLLKTHRLGTEKNCTKTHMQISNAVVSLFNTLQQRNSYSLHNIFVGKVVCF
jgi:hypothetical protein